MASARHSHLIKAARASATRTAWPRSVIVRARLPLAGALAIAVAAQTGPGARALAAAGRFTEYFAGVLCLLALTGSVLAGLLATDRTVLLVRHRVVTQVVHRAVALTALGFLAVHILSKIVEGHSHVVDVFVPFLDRHRTFYLGLGTLGAYALVLAIVTGLARRHFAGGRSPWLWRVLHSMAYVAWVDSIVHGLKAGRPPALWVSASYWVCVGLVAVVVGVRVALRLERRSPDRRSGGRSRQAVTGTEHRVLRWLRARSRSWWAPVVRSIIIRRPRPGSRRAGAGHDEATSGRPSRERSVAVRPEPTATMRPHRVDPAAGARPQQPTARGAARPAVRGTAEHAVRGAAEHAVRGTAEHAGAAAHVAGYGGRPSRRRPVTIQPEPPVSLTPPAAPLPPLRPHHGPGAPGITSTYSSPTEMSDEEFWSVLREGIRR